MMAGDDQDPEPEDVTPESLERAGFQRVDDSADAKGILEDAAVRMGLVAEGADAEHAQYLEDVLWALIESMEGDGQWLEHTGRAARGYLWKLNRGPGRKP